MRPAYITAMLSQFSATTAMSWVIEEHRLAACGRLLGDALEDLVLHQDVEAGGRLVGDDQLRIEHQRHGDHRALPHAAAELMRIILEDVPPAVPPSANNSSARRRISRGGMRAMRQRLLELAPERVYGIEAVHRGLRDRARCAAADAAQLGLRHADQVVARR